MNGGVKIADISLSTIPIEWSVQGTGDFNGDGTADILWRRASDGQTVMWEMSGGTKLADVNLNAIPTNWKIQGIGDFNGDGKSDIIWQNDDGAPFIWEMNGTSLIGAFGPPNPGPTWHIKDDGPIALDSTGAGAQSASAVPLHV